MQAWYVGFELVAALTANKAASGLFVGFDISDECEAVISSAFITRLQVHTISGQTTLLAAASDSTGGITCDSGTQIVL